MNLPSWSSRGAASSELLTSTFWLGCHLDGWHRLLWGIPCAVFACEVVFRVKSTRCPPDGTPVLESNLAVPPQNAGWIAFSSRSVGRDSKGSQAPKNKKKNRLGWNERPRIISFRSNRYCYWSDAIIYSVITQRYSEAYRYIGKLNQTKVSRGLYQDGRQFQDLLCRRRVRYFGKHSLIQGAWYMAYTRPRVLQASYHTINRHLIYFQAHIWLYKLTYCGSCLLRRTPSVYTRASQPFSACICRRVFSGSILDFFCFPLYSFFFLFFLFLFVATAAVLWIINAF